MGRHARRPSAPPPGKAAKGAWLIAGAVAVTGLAATGGAAHADTPGVERSDFDNSGSSDLVASVPAASSSAGAVSVLPGGASGPSATGRKILTQNSGSVPGSSEKGDRFGAATASGDLDGDGRLDLVVGAPGEDDTSGTTDRGAVTILTGKSGLTGGTYFTTGSRWGTAQKARLGTDVEVGDINGDGLDDAIGIGPGTAGSAPWVVWRDSATGATHSGAVGYDPAVAIDGAVGDFNADGHDDLAVTVVDVYGTAKVYELTGSASGFEGGFGAAVSGGRAVDAGDINGDGHDDLVVGQPVAADANGRAGGQITVKLGSAAGLQAQGGTLTVHQATTGVPGAAEAGDAMGTDVALSDLDGDGTLDIVAGLPGEDLTVSGTSRKNAGAALLLRLTGSADGTGVALASAQALQQGRDGIGGVPESADRFGSAVAADDFTGTDATSLVIGAEGENTGDGTMVHRTAGGTGTYVGRSVAGTPVDGGLGGVLAP
ncbi:FG-GAP-like repeat-containing protein [Streptomyces meridianus]|uniref:FG-GAP-like repeat-containing protein n=1 Tax=Streptomyces meridianus TaxID=2938945 RepID=A0ABT0X9B4_9ACTN|nr:FG-GAP-like repeat-containing protein [Streptomyces meridianus]MCM2579121.1 FG-GAP-like repeat-containing protein [Streptomyces meridianus]